MRKIGLFVLMATVLIACTNREKKKENPDTASPEVLLRDTHNASNSLSYGGTYEGAIPGMDMVITLDYDGNYTKKHTPKDGKTGNTSASTGKFRWDEAGTVITLTGKEDGEKFKVVENAIILLDKDGKEIAGDSAEMYRLKQTSVSE